MLIWLDDLRNPVDYGYPNAVWCKNYSDFMMCLLSAVEENILPEEIRFDNDLGEIKEGYDAFLSVEGLLHQGELKSLKRIYVHSSNPSAVQKFMGAKESLKENFGIEMFRVQY